YILGVGSLLTFDFRGPLHGPNASKAVSPLVPFDFLIVALAPAKAADPPRSGITPARHDNTIASLNFDTINFLHKLEFRRCFPAHVA
ncbi:MAG TPA: hypothetical protein VFE60_18455, partial [Roseiarcus sp.]|nr:hypothetical protein [Roseiarcus sp.]